MNEAVSPRKKFKINNNKYKEYTVEELIKAYEPLAKSWYSKYNKNNNYDYDDIMQEINIAIAKAYNDYDINVSVSIGYYLNICIRNALHNYCITSEHFIYNKKCMSLDGEYGNPEYNMPLSNYIADTKTSNVMDDVLEKISITQMISELSPLEQKIIKDIYINNKSQESIAKNLNTTQAQISKIKTKSLKQMRQYYMQQC